MTKHLTVGLLAGEASGDNLGAGLMRQVKARLPADYEVEFIGIGGDRMLADGLRELASIHDLSVNGFKDPIIKLPSLLRTLRNVGDQIIAEEVDAFIGIDFNVFNFLLEGRLRRAGIRTAHYVSPSVYAWRRGRTKRVAKVADMIFCLYPFEPPFYEGMTVEPVFVGHPMADEISLEDGSDEARNVAQSQLTVPQGKTIIAVLPGSRGSEVDLMLPTFLAAMRLILASRPESHFLIPAPHQRLYDKVSAQLTSDLPVQLVLGGARTVLQAADVALVKSGTSTLEAMLLRRPMVVSYRLGALTYQLVKRLLRTPFVALPNILLGREKVPELLQDQGTPEALAKALLTELEKAQRDQHYFDEFEALHKELRRDANATAARAVLRLCGLGDTT